MAIRQKIGEVLVEAGLITQEQLDNALSLAIQEGKRTKRLGKVLIELGYVTEFQIAEALSKQLSIPLVDCDNYNIGKDLLALVPKEIAGKMVALPLEQNGKKLLLATADPLDWSGIDDLSFRTGLKISVAVSPETSIINAIEKYYSFEEPTWDLLNELSSHEEAEFLKEIGENKDVNIQHLYKLSEAPPIVKFVTKILVDAVKSRASDVHIEPQEKCVQVRYRVDGELKNTLKFPKYIQDSVISRIKIISNLNITNRRLPQDGRSTLKLEKKVIDLRISSLPTVYGENIVIRLLDHSTGLIPLYQLGMPENIIKYLMTLAGQPQGMILVTGPTGSGKTTTLYAILQQLRSETESIFSIEDPVEYKISGMTQVGINEAVNFTFATALRSILRQDPDIIMVGEIRDLETAEIAVRAALTGHLVLSTVHTNDTVSTITRLLDIGLDPYLISSALTGVLAQRLVRRICPKCKVKTEPNELLIRREFPPLKENYKGNGCDYCQYTGYRGQIGIYEFLLINKKLKRMIAKDVFEEDLWDVAKESGATALFENAWGKIEEGLTTVEEVIAKIPYKSVGGESPKVRPV